jgi:predicted porin
MKKSLLAVAALGAFASAAQAQSSVTVYGIMDAGYVGGNMRAVDSKGVVTKTQVSQFGQSQENTSRLGFKGTEDLGGGTSAFFTIEAGLTPQNPALGGTVARDSFQGTDQNGGSSIDNRQSFVGLKKNGLGQAAFGRQYTVIFNAGAATDPSQYANVLGNVIYNGSSITGVDGSGGNTGSSANAAFTNRASNALTFQSDKFAGFGLNGMYALNNQNATQYATQSYLAAGSSTGLSSAGGNTNWNGWGLSGDFAWQKLYLTVAYQSFKTQYSNAVLGSGSATSVNLGSSATGGQVIPAGQTLFPASTLADKQTYVGGTYDFGVLKAYAQWVGRKIQQDNANGLASTGQTGAQLNRTAQQIGVRSFITPTIEAWGSAGTGKVKGAPLLATGDLASVNFVGWQLGSNYYLSKRTNLYAIYGQQQSTSATGGTAGSGATANQYALGMRHTF